jgi:hypothetical protein
MIAELALKFVQEALPDNILHGKDENENAVETKIKQLCIAFPENRNIDETEGEEFYPIVIIDEEGSEPAPNSRTDLDYKTPEYNTALRIWVISNNKDEARDLCFALQVIIFDGFVKLRRDSDSNISNITRGRKGLTYADFLGNGNTWQASRVLTVLNKIEP